MIILSVCYIIGFSFIKDSITFHNFVIANIDYIGIMSIALFALVKNCTEGETRQYELFLANMSFGMYVFHAVFLNFINKALCITPAQYSIYILWPCVFIAVSICSIMTTYLWKKIPYLKEIL